MIGIWILLFLLSQAALSSEFHSALQRLQRIVLDASIERSTVGASGLRIICFFCRCSKHSFFFSTSPPKAIFYKHNGSSLEWHGSFHTMLPKWVISTILRKFRRIRTVEREPRIQEPRTNQAATQRFFLWVLSVKVPDRCVASRRERSWCHVLRSLCTKVIGELSWESHHIYS